MQIMPRYFWLESEDSDSTNSYSWNIIILCWLYLYIVNIQFKYELFGKIKNNWSQVDFKIRRYVIVID